MKVKYDPDSDAMYIRLQEGKRRAKTERVNYNTLIDFDSDNKPVGVEFIFVSDFMGKSELKSLIRAKTTAM